MASNDKKRGSRPSKPIAPKKIKKALAESNDVIDTIKSVITKDMLVFSREEAGWILDITHDYIQMVKHTRATSEEIKKGYESFLKPDAQLPEGVTVEMIASDLEKMKEDAKFLDVAELRTTILRDAAQNFIMSQPDTDDATPEQESEDTSGTANVDTSEPVHSVSEEDTSVLPTSANEGNVPTTPVTPNTIANRGQPA